MAQGLVKKREENGAPESLSLSSFADGAWFATVFARVLDAKGFGVKDAVVRFEFDGKKDSKTTDREGECQIQIHRALEKGESAIVRVTVSGIKEAAVLRLRRPRQATPAVSPWSFGWLLGSSRGRGVLFLIMALVLFTVACYVGFGDPLLAQTELSLQQKKFNEIVKDINPEHMVKLPESKGTWQHWVWLLVALWTPFSILYYIFSFRERVAEAIRDGIESIRDKSSTTVSTPILERLAVWSGDFAQSQRGGANAIVYADGRSVSKDLTFWELFKPIMSAEIIMAIMQAFFRNLVWRR